MDAQPIIAIDPGVHGAVSVLSEGGGLLDVVDMPTVEVKVGKGKRSRIAPQALALLILSWKPAHAFVERVGPMPNDGATGAFNFGMCAGQVDGILAALAVPVTYITPQTWKKAHGLAAEKGEARRRAMQLFPARASDFQRVKDDGRAESALIGLYGLRTMQRVAA